MGKNGLNGNAPLVIHQIVPIVGQPYQLLSWFPTIVIRCNCHETKPPILLIGEAIVECPQCHKKWQAQIVEWNKSMNTLAIGIATIDG